MTPFGLVLALPYFTEVAKSSLLVKKGVEANFRKKSCYAGRGHFKLFHPTCKDTGTSCTCSYGNDIMCDKNTA
jgi:hypothetical protein